MNELYGDRAWVYDAAFSWDVQQEVSWLIERCRVTPGPELDGQALIWHELQRT